MVLMSTMLWEGESEFEFIESWPDCYVSYLNQDQKRLIHFWLFHDQEEVEPDSKDHFDRNFVGLLKEQNPVSFPDLVYISTLYDPFHFYDSTKRIPPFGPRLIVGDFLDQMFLESRGRIVYHYPTGNAVPDFNRMFGSAGDKIPPGHREKRRMGMDGGRIVEVSRRQNIEERDGRTDDQ